ncbi:hypothetical protein JCM33374_g3427 [Metschnikowia sp. JCM 33374]|nr:hypothetical protein JCM33374_g3427 [Metschnikowia sp. JCM 33374]
MKVSSQVTIVSPSTAAKILAGPSRVVPVDATWHMPNSPQNAHDQFYNEDRLPGSVFFDLDHVCDRENKYPHMLPNQAVFNANIEARGISSSDSVLVYDRSGVFSGPRAAWTFSLFGHENVYLLDHYRQYKSEFDVDRRPLPNDGAVKLSSPGSYDGIDSAKFASRYRAQVIDFEELADLVTTKTLTQKYHVFDARSKGRFTGEEPEPRKGLSSGHIPGALSLPFSKVLDINGHYKSREELISLFREDFGIDLDAPLEKEGIIVSCGTGVTAVILQMAIHKVSTDIPVRVYDGSWTEWAQRAPHLIEKS